MNDWPTLRAQIIDAFDGELPGATLEQAIVDLYEANPACVQDSYPSVATSLTNGKINSGWAVLKKAAAERNSRKENPTVHRERRILNADQWMRNAGLHYDRWDEVDDDLFGDRGPLRELATDKLRSRYHDAWQTIRQLGETVEADQISRMQHWKETRDQVVAALKRKPAVDEHEHDDTPELGQPAKETRAQTPLHPQGAA